MNARDAALLALDALSLPGWKPNLLRRRHSGDLDPRDRGLSEQLRIGVIKNLLLLQRLTETFAHRPLAKLDPLAQKVIAVGLYQLRFLSRIPPHSAVNEAVEQIRRFGNPRAAGLVNAVLRNATRDPVPPLPIEIELSHPAELMHRLEQLAGPQAAVDIARHDNAEPPTIVRLFPGHTPDELSDPDVQITPHETPHLYVVTGAKKSHFARWSAAGIAQVQDPTAARVALACDIHPGMRVLDRCAGRGTKTLQLAHLTGPTGSVVAVDAAGPRCADLQRLVHERQLTNVSVLHASWMSQSPATHNQQFDRILLDLPCSNSGVLARRPEARYHQDAHTLESVATLQRRILLDTAPHTAPTRLLIYSTCSIWPEENQRQVAEFLHHHPQFTMVEDHLTLPSTTEEDSTYHDGGYFAVLRQSDERHVADRCPTICTTRV